MSYTIITDGLQIYISAKKDEMVFIGSLFDVMHLKKQRRTKLNQLNQITLNHQYNIYIYIYILTFSTRLL